MRIFALRALRFAPVLILAAVLPALAAADTLRVPGDHPLITQALAAARAGDVIEVADGFYFEINIVIDKAVTLRSKNLFGAVIAGSDNSGEAIFIVRAPCLIEGFILKDARAGILQRDSPDVDWEGRNLALFRLERGIAIDDRKERRGAARLSDIIADGCGQAFATNEARAIDVTRALVANAETAFAGSNHLRFDVRDIVAWNCRNLSQERDGAGLPPPSTDRVNLGPRVYSFDSRGGAINRESLQKRLNALFFPAAGRPALPADQVQRRDALLLLIAGDIFLQNGNPQAAARHYRTALEVDPAKPKSEITWRALIGLSSALEAGRGKAESLPFLKKAIDIIEADGASIPIRAFQNFFRRDKIGIYEVLIGKLVDLDREQPGRGFDREALFYAEKSRARGFMTGLKALDVNPAVSELNNRVRSLNQTVTRIQLRLQDPDLPDETRRALLAKLEKAEINRTAFILDNRRRELETGRFQFPDPCGLEEIRTKLLRPDAGLLEFVLGEQRSFAFLATVDGLDIALLPPAAEIRPLIVHFLKFLTLRESKDFRGREGSRILAGILLDPFRDRLARGVKTLYVVPDGVLHYLPFETLLRASGGRERFLIEDFEIAYGPSASGLIRLAERPAPVSFPMDFLGVANTRAFPIFTFSERERILFPELPFGLSEIRAIRRFYARARTTVLLENEAREDRLKHLNLSDFRVIHIVAHGFFDDSNWARSALLLLPGEYGVEDGFLQANDIFVLNLRPDLLVLSGCQTGAGLLEKGEGVTGLASAFFFAGARSILLSLWNVNDKAAASFMKSFYRHFAAGEGKAAALRKAKLEMLAGAYGHPYYWASFVLQGQ